MKNEQDYTSELAEAERFDVYENLNNRNNRPYVNELAEAERWLKAQRSLELEKYGKAKKLQITEIKFTYKKLEDDTMELKSDTEIFGIVDLKADNFDINGYTITQDTLLRIKDFIANEIRQEITKLTIL